MSHETKEERFVRRVCPQLPLVIVMSGVSGSGKSTLARKLRKLIVKRKSDGIIVSADDFFYQGGKYIYDRAKLGAAHAHCFSSFIRALTQRVPLVIVDNTNIKPTDISPYMLGASAFGYASVIVEVHCNPLQAASRNLHGADIRTVQGMFKMLCERQLEPYWRVVPWEIT